MKHKLALPLLLASLLVLGGCAAMQESDTRQKEKQLASAGFVAKPIDTDKRRSLAATLTPNKLQSRIYKGSIIYLYPDPAQNVVYVGDAAAYTAYQKIQTEKELITQQQMSNMEYDAWATQITGGADIYSLPDNRIR